MCDHLATAEQALSAAGPLQLRRPLTDHEHTHGDIPRVHEDFNAAEIAVAKSAAPVVAKMLEQLLSEAAPLIASGDTAGLATLRASYTAQLATALAAGMDAGVRAGRQHILDAHERQTGVRGAESGHTVMNATASLALAEFDPLGALKARALLAAMTIGDKLSAAVRYQAQTAILQGAEELTADMTAQVEAASARSLAGVAKQLGRDALGNGRTVQLDEMQDAIDYIVYSAVLDQNTCIVCENSDGNVYSDDDPSAVGSIDEGLTATPNPECEGSSMCRCIMVVVFK